MIMKITLAMLRAKKACEDQRELFKATFGEEAEVTLDNCLKAAAADLNLPWAAEAFFTSPVRAEYDKVCAAAQVEYNKVCAPGRAEYDKVRTAAQAEYEKVCAKACDAAWAEYNKACDAAWAEYNKVRAPARVEYDKVCAAAWAEYAKVCARAFYGASLLME